MKLSTFCARETKENEELPSDQIYGDVWQSFIAFSHVESSHRDLHVIYRASTHLCFQIYFKIASAELANRLIAKLSEGGEIKDGFEVQVELVRQAERRIAFSSSQLSNCALMNVV